jgi:2-hydroxy-3-keto-5-methylthiopentenyl-1-phosphate phosphatase
VLDWDGTVTEHDTLSLVMERFGDIGLWGRTGRAMGHTMTHDEAIATSFRTVRAPLEEVLAWLLPRVRVREGFAELVARHRPLVLSSGFHELIEPVLAREGVGVDLLANHVEARPDGWRIAFRERGSCDVCGEACKRAALPPGDVVYVGDGYSDRCAALAARRVFARGTLAEDLRARGVPYEPFDDLRDVAAALEPGDGRAGS